MPDARQPAVPPLPRCLPCVLTDENQQVPTITDRITAAISSNLGLFMIFGGELVSDSGDRSRVA